MEILKFKKMPGTSLAAILHLQLPLKAIGERGGMDRMGGGTNKSL